MEQFVQHAPLRISIKLKRLNRVLQSLECQTCRPHKNAIGTGKGSGAQAANGTGPAATFLGRGLVDKSAVLNDVGFLEMNHRDN